MTEQPSMKSGMYVSANPYNWPFDGNLKTSNTCLMIIDMQVDFCGKGGYVDKMGYDLHVTRKPIEPIQRVLECMRKKGYPIFHTREGHRSDLSDCHANKLWRSQQINAEIGSKGPLGRILVRGESGWDIIPELKPNMSRNEIIIDKPGHSAFVGTDLDLILRNKGIRNIILVGVTTDVCVFSTMRNANDLGYECLLLQDCSAATNPDNHKAVIDMIQEEGGIFGSVSDSNTLLNAL